MPKQEIIHLRPTGWESDPLDEFFKLSTLDYFVGQVYIPFAFFFKLPDDNDHEMNERIVSTLKHALERTLSQCRQLCGVLEPHPDDSNELCFHKTRASTVEFHVQHLDNLDNADTDAYPSFAHLEARHFTSVSLGSLHTWTIAPMAYGFKPTSSPSHNPKAASFKANFIRGGLVLVMHIHHYANDAQGCAGVMHQLAENCAAIWSDSNAPNFPPWDPTCLDKSRVTGPDVPVDKRIDCPIRPTPHAHPDHKPGRKMLLFHLSKSKAAELKKLASPVDENRWISSYDAFMALTWRVLTRHRARLFEADLNQKLFWGETVDLRKRLDDPPVPERVQGNWVWAALSLVCKDAVPEFTVGEVVDGVSLAELAWYIRRLTNTATPAALTAGLPIYAPIRDKTSLFHRTDSFQPLSNMVSDWRGVRACEADFGFGRPVAFRMLMDIVTMGMVIVYPVRKIGDGDGDGDDGVEVCVAVEREIVSGLLADEEWTSFFEFRGVDAEEGGD